MHPDLEELVPAQVYFQVPGQPSSLSSTLKCKIETCSVIFFLPPAYILEEWSLTIVLGDALCILNSISVPTRGGVTFTTQIQPNTYKLIR